MTSLKHSMGYDTDMATGRGGEPITMRLSLRVPTFLAPGGFKVLPMSMLSSHDRSTNYVLLHEQLGLEHWYSEIFVQFPLED